MDGRPYLLRGGRENALTKKIGNNFSCTCLLVIEVRGFLLGNWTMPTMSKDFR